MCHPQRWNEQVLGNDICPTYAEPLRSRRPHFMEEAPPTIFQMPTPGMRKRRLVQRLARPWKSPPFHSCWMSSSMLMQVPMSCFACLVLGSACSSKPIPLRSGCCVQVKACIANSCMCRRATQQLPAAAEDVGSFAGGVAWTDILDMDSRARCRPARAPGAGKPRRGEDQELVVEGPARRGGGICGAPAGRRQACVCMYRGRFQCET